MNTSGVPFDIQTVTSDAVEVFGEWLAKNRLFESAEAIRNHVVAEASWRSNLPPQHMALLAAGETFLLTQRPRHVFKDATPFEQMRQHLFERITNAMNAKYVEVTGNRPFNFHRQVFYRT